MRVSDLIDSLQLTKAIWGDLPVRGHPDGVGMEDIVIVRVHTEDNKLAMKVAEATSIFLDTEE